MRKFLQPQSGQIKGNKSWSCCRLVVTLTMGLSVALRTRTRITVSRIRTRTSVLV
nr:MAG TPA: hypothetical protein [Bacteriophage sp.]